MRFINVVLPAPLGPTMPNLSLRSKSRFRFLTISRSPNDFDIFLASATSLPEISLDDAESFTLPWAPTYSRRSPRSVERRPTRRTLRLRRAVTPYRIQCSSVAMRAANLCCSISSSSRTWSRHSSKCAKPRFMRFADPRSSQMVRFDSASRNLRSWLMRMKAERRDFSSASSHSMAGRSRWLVGSSSSRISGSGARVLAMAARLDSPPESCAGFSSPVRPSSFK